MIAKLARRQLFSQLRRSDWRALLISIFLMTSLITLLSLTGDRLQKSVAQRSADFLGADMVLSSSRPLADTWQQDAQKLGLQSAPVTQFASMTEAGDAMLLASIRAVTPPYPLRGEITLKEAAATTLPELGNIWAEPNVLSRLGIAVGDTLQIGYSTFTVSHVITASPDRGSGFRSFNPQIIMRSEDLAATGVIAPGSRAQYRLLLAGDADALATFKAESQTHLQSWQRLYEASGDQPTTRNAIGNAGQYLRLSALFALLLGAFAIYLSMRRFAADQQQRTALLLSLGLPRAKLLPLFSWQLVLGWLLAAIPGTFIGLGLHQLMMLTLADLLPKPLPAIDLFALFSSAALAGAVLMLAGLTTLLPLGKASILSLFNPNSDSTFAQNKRLYWILPPGLFLLMVLFVESVVLAALLSVTLLLAGWLAGWVVQRLIHHACSLLKGRLRLMPLLTLRIRQQRQWHRVQGGVLVLLLTLMTVLFFARQDLLQQWQSQLPADTPNRFVINIQPWEKDGVTEWLAEQQIDSQLYPMIRGRITSVNGVDKDDAFTPTQLEHNTLNRELNLTFTDAIPAHNTLEAGAWSDAKESISVEQSMATDLGLQLGDTLGFQVGSETFTGRITSIRGVEWASFRPNFYVIFSPGVIDALPATYITSFRLDSSQQGVSKTLLSDFPTLTVIDIEQLLAQAQELIGKLSDSASMIMVLTLLSGLVLIITIVQQDLVKRRFEVALLRTMGATERQTRQLDMLEYCMIGCASGLVACFISEGLLALIYQQLLKITPQWHPLLWLCVPAIAVLLLTITGRLVRKPLPLPTSYTLLKSGS